MLITFNKTKNSYLFVTNQKRTVYLFKPQIFNKKNTYLFQYWNEKHKYLKLLMELKNGWRNELLFQFRKNNTQVVLHSSRRPDPIFREYVFYLPKHKALKQSMVSTLSLSFQTGRLGFVKNQKKSVVAAEALINTAFWIMKRHHNVMAPLKFRLVGQTMHFNKYNKHFLKYLEYCKNNEIYSIVDSTPISFGMLKFKATARKRFRYHLFNFRDLVNKKKDECDFSNVCSKNTDYCFNITFK